MTDDTPPADEPKSQDAATPAHAPPETASGEAAREPDVASERRTAPAAATVPEPQPAAPPPTEPEPVVDTTAREPATPEATPAPVAEVHAEPTPETNPETITETMGEAAPAADEQSISEAEAFATTSAGAKAELETPASEPEAVAEAKPAKPAKPRKARTPKAAPADETAAVLAPSEGAPPAEAQTESKKKWYAVKVQSGREESIKAAIERKVKIEGLEESFGQIVIPVEEEIVKKQVKVKDKKTGETSYQEKKVTRKKKKFQGYLFAELEFNDRILYLFRETSGVGDFLNLRGTPPVPEPMPDHEVQSMLTGVAGPKDKKKPAKVKLDFEKGDKVRIRDGPFKDNEGEVKSISEPKDPTDTPKVTVVVTIWGRPVDVDLDYWHVDKV